MTSTFQFETIPFNSEMGAQKMQFERGRPKRSGFARGRAGRMVKGGGGKAKSPQPVFVRPHIVAGGTYLFPNDDDDTDLIASDYDDDGELPPEISGFFSSHKITPPNYGPQAIALDAIAKRRDLKGKSGLYLITFSVAGKQRAYSGKANDLQKRLLQHRLCLSHLGVPTSGYQVYIKEVNKAQVRTEEKDFHTQLLPVIRKFKPTDRMFTNVNTELESF